MKSPGGIRKPAAVPTGRPDSIILALQRSAGNAGVVHLLAAASASGQRVSPPRVHRRDPTVQRCGPVPCPRGVTAVMLAPRDTVVNGLAVELLTGHRHEPGVPAGLQRTATPAP